MVKKYLPLAAMAVLGLTSVASAAQNTKNGDACKPTPPAVCYPDDCAPCQRCLGPENFAANPPVCPSGCNGDWEVTAAALYWVAHQDGMEYALVNGVTNPNAVATATTAPLFTAAIQQLNQLANAEYKHPSSKWDWGFKVGLGYCSSCDGWDAGLTWTWYHGKAHNDVDADPDQNSTLLPLWSGFVPAQGSVLYATDGEAEWKLHLNLVDFELGRNYWVSKYLAIRPFIGLRYALIKQFTDITYQGGSWNTQPAPAPSGNVGTGFVQSAYNGLVNLDNKYNGAGIRAGLDSTWNFGCGWAIYGDLAASIIYGRFKVDHNEAIRLAANPHTVTNILNTEEHFHAARAILDLGLGIQWSTMFCSCKYGLTAKLGWEQHMFFDQNQMWRVSRVNAQPSSFTAGTGTPAIPTLNNTGDNVIQQRRGSLDAQGWTLSLRFGF